MPASISCCAKTNTSTTSSNRTTGPSNRSPGRCLDSSHSGAPGSPSQESRPCT
jgi:hypothetical protein